MINQRTIKFRCWDKKRKFMLPSEQILHIEFDMKGVKWVGGWVAGYDNEGNAEQQLGQIDNPILQQFTGLLDKNEKKIFEGDILENKSEVICGNQFGDITIKKTYKKGKKTEEVIFHEIRKQEDLEVIGNIFENKNLLNK